MLSSIHCLAHGALSGIEKERRHSLSDVSWQVHLYPPVSGTAAVN